MTIVYILTVAALLCGITGIALACYSMGRWSGFIAAIDYEDEDAEVKP